ncbi:MAG: type II secretion system protein GspG [Verrucomicrobiota bacterium]
MRRLALIFLVMACGSCCMHTITSVEMTWTAIDETFVRIAIYAETNKAVAPSLDVLPKRDGYANQTTDGWKRPLQYRVAKDGIITLTSLGADGKPGGSGENADISKSYRAKRPDGSLWVGAPMWIAEAEVK